MDNVMDFDHRDFTDKLSDYLDGELPAAERVAIEAHLAGCTQCAAVLADLKRVVARAQALEPRPPQADLWAAVAAHIDQQSAGKIVAFEPRRRISFTLPQLAAAAAVLIAVSGGIARQTLAGDPANSYLSSHLFEARRRKLDLLRRAAALSSESD